MVPVYFNCHSRVPPSRARACGNGQVWERIEKVQSRWTIPERPHETGLQLVKLEQGEVLQVRKIVCNRLIEYTYVQYVKHDWFTDPSSVRMASVSSA